MNEGVNNGTELLGYEISEGFNDVPVTTLPMPADEDEIDVGGVGPSTEVVDSNVAVPKVTAVISTLDPTSKRNEFSDWFMGKRDTNSLVTGYIAEFWLSNGEFDGKFD